MTRHLIDAHLHLWELDRHPQPWIDPESMSEIDRDFTASDAAGELGRHGIVDAVVVQADNSLSETEDLIAAAATGSVVKAVVGWVDLLGDVPAQLARLRGLRGGAALVGVRHLAHLEPDPAWLLRPDVTAGLTAVAEAGLVVELVVRAHQLRVVTELVDALPAASFVLDHLGKPPLLAGGAELERWRTDLADLARHPNVVAKVSGLGLEADHLGWTAASLRPAVDHALETFGPDRLMFGSDWPLVRLTRGYTAWWETYLQLTAALGAAGQKAIDHGTARRTYGIPSA
ncbi:amidohydrolase family protein [Promicromonospora soli]|uniref:Amidohydrolase n=1 Tax=Promicromonospora soli TaxID=2035533 RepID=A0A919FH01_9MICO|nr:amidohydrolase family protein [Promicromonospora soli]GHH65395.1 amidohydrolase [Promicromonospora soli]